eukprot:TRINITY_DN6042_c0_g2_i1.p1 TRINITY_DN6042_c0_g2~~TRINITY_DN6042_c0_g2_i1.p1  ORF type:complete len:108 (+),score=27.19 TRINITY_DN6042_c0_g2_i1:50-325(+)
MDRPEVAPRTPVVDPNAEVVIPIESPTHAMVKVFRFAPTTTVEQVIEAFLVKFPVDDASGYGMKKIMRDPITTNSSIKKQEEAAGVFFGGK